jgi:hypothetical protein
LVGDASQRSAGRHSRKVDRKRKLKVDTKAKPVDRWATQVADRFERRPLNPAADGSRRLGSKAEAGRLANGESRKLAGRYSWKVDQRRKPKVSTKAELENRSAAKVAGRFGGSWRMQQPMRVGG